MSRLLAGCLTLYFSLDAVASLAVRFVLKQARNVVLDSAKLVLDPFRRTGDLFPILVNNLSIV